jgi:hypothetical protein
MKLLLHLLVPLWFSVPSGRDGTADAGVADWQSGNGFHYHSVVMAFPIKVCVVCSEEFELKPDKPGFANRCPSCSEPESNDSPIHSKSADKGDREANEARRQAMKNLLYRKDS